MKKILLPVLITILTLLFAFCIAGCSDDAQTPLAVGPTGPTGATGPAGTNGPTGATGITGPSGPGQIGSLTVNVFEEDGTTAIKNFNLKLNRIGVVSSEITAHDQAGTGSYRFDNLAVGTYRITATALSYDTTTKDVTIVEGNNSTNILMLVSLYGVSFDTFYRVSPTTGAETLVGPVTGYDSISAMDVNPLTGILYATGNDNNLGENVLLTIDPNTGAGTTVATLSNQSNTPDISFHSDGTLFGYFRTGPNRVGTIDLTTGTVTLLPNPTGYSGGGNGIAFLPVASGSYPANTLFHASDNDFNTIDTTTGIATNITTLTDEPVNAMDFKPGTNLLYAFFYVPDGNSPNYLATIDITTGAITVIGANPAAVGLTAICWPR